MKNMKNTWKLTKKIKRTFSGLFLLLLALTAIGFMLQAFTPKSNTSVAVAANEIQIRNGNKLYNDSCMSCHGAALEGVKGRGPSLQGVGSAAVYFQVSSGRMPYVRNEAQALRKPALFNTKQIDQLMSYIQTKGGGPSVVYVRDSNGNLKKDINGNLIIAQKELRGNDIARGGELFRLNCASCHNFTGRGGALSSGKFAPGLDPVNEQQIYTAMLTGPENMPKFSDRQLTPTDKKDIIGYIKHASETKSPGGLALGGYGPVSEGMTMWFVGVSLLILAAIWIGVRS